MTTMTTREYFAKSGSSLSKEDAEIIGPEIERLADGTGITPSAVVLAAVPRSSPLHPYFEWDDSEAAHHYRLIQARKLMGSIEVKIVASDGSEHRVRSFFAIPVAPGATREEHKFMPIEVIRADTDMSMNVIEEAYRALTGWEQRFQTYQKIMPTFQEKFGPVFDAINKVRGEASLG